jgi:D-cysteine desulfhydrase
LYIKHDDQTGLATGGNKTRKLEYLVQEAIDLNCDTLITAGAQQSNHCRQTAAAAAQLGMECYLLLGGYEPAQYGGNLLLSKLLGAQIHFTGPSRKGEQLNDLKQQLESEGRRCHLIPYGGSNVTGALGFVNAIRELKVQEAALGLEFDHIVFASSSGGTQAGMILGKELFGLSAELHPISIDKEGINGIDLEHIVLDLVKEGVRAFKIPRRYSLGDCRLNRAYEHSGYGKPTREEIQSIQYLASTEGILLDPVYTGRAFHGLLQMLEADSFEPGSKILFWHTGGVPALFEQSELLLA